MTVIAHLESFIGPYGRRFESHRDITEMSTFEVPPISSSSEIPSEPSTLTLPAPCVAKYIGTSAPRIGAI